MPELRSEIARQIAKAFAYQNAGKDVTAREHAEKAIELINKQFTPSPFKRKHDGK